LIEDSSSKEGAMRLMMHRILPAAMLVAVIVAGTPAAAATPDEEAAEAARAYVKAVMARDVDAQLKLLPKGYFANAADRERRYKRLLHEKEMAVINDEKYVSFDVQPKIASGKVGNNTVIVFPYRSVTKNREARTERQSSLLAIAEEGSSNWSVIDGTGQSARSMKGYLPAYNGNPPIPKAVVKALPAD